MSNLRCMRHAVSRTYDTVGWWAGWLDGWLDCCWPVQIEAGASEAWCGVKNMMGWVGKRNYVVVVLASAWRASDVHFQFRDWCTTFSFCRQHFGYCVLRIDREAVLLTCVVGWEAKQRPV